MRGSVGRGDGAGGHLLIQVLFHNISPTVCVLAGYPSVIASQAGQPDVTGHDGSFFPVDSSANMAPGEDTDLGLETDTYCADRPDGGGGGPPYHHLVIAVPGGGDVALDTAAGLDVTCGLHLTPFFVPQPAMDEPPTPLQRLTAALETPDSVASGTTLIYIVDLTNPTDQAVRLDPCPAYIQSAPPPAAIKDVEALNCAATGAIPAHGTVRFEMHMPIPAAAPPGPMKIFWMLIGPDAASVASVTVTASATSASS